MSFRKASFHMIPATAFLLSFLQFIVFIIMFSMMKECYRLLLNKEIYKNKIENCDGTEVLDFIGSYRRQEHKKSKV